MKAVAIEGGTQPQSFTGLPTSLGREFGGWLQSLWGSSLLYQLALRGPAPERIATTPKTYRQRAAKLGAALLDRRLTLAGREYQLEEGRLLETFWDLPLEDPAASSELHGFNWLRHLQPLQDAGRTAARELVAGWITRFGHWDRLGWAPEITARRLTNWLRHNRLFLQNADLVWRSQALISMARQTRHLSNSAHRAPEGLPRLEAAASLMLAGACLPSVGKAFERGSELLRRELRLQILPDGGHMSRNPSVQLEVLIHVLTIVDALNDRRRPAPGFLRHAIDKMTPMVRYFRHGDGGLALFQGAVEDDSEALEVTLAHDDMHAKPFGFAPHTGYQRVSSGRALVIMDVGKPASGVFRENAHNGPLAFEFSVGRDRFVVNCGAAHGMEASWREALCGPNAHSTLGLERLDGAPSGRRGASRRAPPYPIEIGTKRFEDDSGFWLEATRTGFSTAKAGAHQRRVFLSAYGDDLRGEDILTLFSGESADARFAYTLRFHLHPNLKASLARDKKSVLLIPQSGEGWRFRSDQGEIALESSVYVGDGLRPRACEQIILRGEANGRDPEHARVVLKWAFRRMERGGRGRNQ